MAFDADKYTDKELNRLEAKIQKEYSKASKDMRAKWSEYIKGYTDSAGVYHKGLQDRYLDEYKAYQEGKYTDAQFKAWYKAQVGRGNHWKNLSNDMAERLNHSAEIAQGYINGKLPTIYAKNSNAVADIAKKSAMEQGVTGIRYDMADAHAVKRLMESKNAPFKKAAINLPRQYTYNLRKLENALLQGIISGDSIEHLADRFQNVTGMNRSQAIRNARTAVTGAQSAGKQDRFDDLADQGVEFTKIWVATNDDRTREAHMEADGQEVPYDEPFDVGGEDLMYPGDESGSPENIYNCRCTMKTGTPRFKSILDAKTKAHAGITVE